MATPETRRRTRRTLDQPPVAAIPGQLDLTGTQPKEPDMRTNHETTNQTTCDGDDFCPEYVLSASFERVPAEQREARHRAFVAKEGWTDHEGRDYCPEHSPVNARPTP